MAPILAALTLVLLQVARAAVGGSEGGLLRSCGTDRVGYLRTQYGYEVFVNGQRFDDRVLLCDVLAFYFVMCVDVDSEAELRNIVRGYCGWEMKYPADLDRDTVSVDALHLAGRKLLVRPMLDSFGMEQLIRNGLSHGQVNDQRSALHDTKKAMAVPGMLLLCCMVICPCFRAKRKEPIDQKSVGKMENSFSTVSPFEEAASSPDKKLTALQKAPSSPTRFPLSAQQTKNGLLQLNINQIIKATQNFSPSLKLGEGEFSTVYKGTLPDGKIVAIKCEKKANFSVLRDEFRNEVELLAKIEHRSLVRLLGFTDKGNERIIVTEYFPNGTLREHLDGLRGHILDFNERLEIAIDVAHALTYLHLYAEKTIIHRDVSASNILLTKSFRAKVSDFGFARTGPTEAGQTHISTKVKGRVGYLDPEYLRTYKLTPKSDVFSFGILLMEILSARRPVEMKRSVEERITLRWAFDKFNEGNLREILDPKLKGNINLEVMNKMFSLAFHCAAPTRANRPPMKAVGEQLWEIRKDFRKESQERVK
ncbi:hypothetical protein HPP92_021719 [Vanilla planifolia]|uniref:non-specific serine/threonine protein kinase n=1 Tax=Vanilla planifolia TaxID=51239 RepID=A0A835UH36_VANPL|nr:hypothetical protein HPP92_021719 [Vanilla planifolia]